MLSPILSLLLLTVSTVYGHVTLRYPPPTILNDFLDNARTTGLCGDMEDMLDDYQLSNLWQLPNPVEITTDVLADSNLTVYWDLHYPHNGGFAIEIYEAGANDGDDPLISWENLGCLADGTQQEATVAIPNITCESCILRLVRQAAEWGQGYRFRSCANINIVAPNSSSNAANACNSDCSGNGECNDETGECECVSSVEDGFFEGEYCERQNECEEDAHCGEFGKCIDIGATTPPGKQCYCQEGYFGEEQLIGPVGSNRLTKRFCDRTSGLTISASETEKWGEMYDNFESTELLGVYWRVIDNEIEFALNATTLSYVAIGWRPEVGPEGQMACQAEAPAADDGSSEEGESEGEDEEDESESEGRKRSLLEDGDSEGEGYKNEDGASESEDGASEDENASSESEDGASEDENASSESEDGASEDENASSESEDGASKDENATSESEDGASEGEGGDADDGSCGVLIGQANEELSVNALLAFYKPKIEAEVLEVYANAAELVEQAQANRGEATDGASEGEQDASEDENGAGEAETADSEAETADSEAETADSEAETADSEAETADSEAETADSEAEAEADKEEGSSEDSAGQGDASTSEAGSSTRRLSAAFAMPKLEQHGVLRRVLLEEDIKMIKRALLEDSESEEGYKSEDADSEGEDADSEGEDADSEGEDADSEGEGGDDAESYVECTRANLPTFGDGPCLLELNPPAPMSHAMDNQDMVIAYARAEDGKQYFRIQDSFTPSRSRPLPDVAFGGQDDITDAVAIQTDTQTLVKFRRPLRAGDAGDYCILKGIQYRSIFALGQISPDGTSHAPSSALENNRGINSEFYREDELKFHGGGVGDLGFLGRGMIRDAVDFHLTADEELEMQTGAGCIPSTLGDPRFQCERTELGITLHYSTPEGGATDRTFFAVHTPGFDGWCGMAFAGTPNMMIGSTAVLYTPADGGKIDVYMLEAYSPTGIVQNNAFEIGDMEFNNDNGSLMIFSRAIDPTFDPTSTVDLLLASHNTDTSFNAPHDNRIGFPLNLQGGESGDAVEVEVVEPSSRRAHAWLMTLGWGVFIPLGIVMAASLRFKDPLWFHLHRAIQLIGLLLALAGFVVALVEFNVGSDNLDDPIQRHRLIGIIVMVFGLFQPLNALLRPHAPKEGEKKSAFRLGWECFHKAAGYLTTIVAIYNIFLGFEQYKLFQGTDEDWPRNVYIGYLCALAALYVVLMVVGFFQKKKVQVKKEPIHSEGFVVGQA